MDYNWIAQAVVSLGLVGCSSYGLLQTAKPLPPGEGRMDVGASWASNTLETDESLEGSGRRTRFVGPQLDYRMGATKHFDIGIGTYLTGLRIDGKYDVANPNARWGLAPRVGIGGGVASGSTAVFAPYAGVLGSVTPVRNLGLYGGATFINHWIESERPSWAEVPEGWTEADSSGWGDGLGVLTVGVAIGRDPDRGGCFHAEYTALIPAQDDPSNYYQFVRSNLVTFGAAF